MIEFLSKPDLWIAGVGDAIGGIVAAVLIALFALLWNCRKNNLQKQLIEIMGQAIKHRNAGDQRAFKDEKVWIQQAKAIEEEAVATAKKISPATGSMVEWLDQVKPYPVGNELEKYK